MQVVVTYDIEVHDEQQLIRAAQESYQAAAESAPPAFREVVGRIGEARERMEDPDHGIYRALEWLIRPHAGWPVIPGAQVLAVDMTGGAHSPDV
jgi:hypothetical protein